jgi:hypothetical protein
LGGSVSAPVLALSVPDRSGPLEARSEKIDDLLSVYAHYRGYHPRSAPRLKATSKEWKCIRARLDEGSTVADLTRAIDGYHRDPWHLGENDRGKPWLGLDLIMRDSSHVLAGIEMLTRPKTPQMTSKNGGAVAAVLAMNAGGKL